MTWKAYRVTLRLLAPMHIGWRKIGNLQQTRPYVTGRNLWGAITARLTRELGSSDYKGIGEQVDKYITFSYFYPSTNKEGVEAWPWPMCENEADADRYHRAATEERWEKFAWLFLGSYASTALDGRSALDGSLHETEFIAPYTRKANNNEAARSVYLIGYIFEKEGCPLNNWKDALNKLQLGGERNYGWGHVRLECCKLVEGENKKCFNYDLDCAGEYPQITVATKKALLAHTCAIDLENVEGILEPLIGRETDTSSSARFGQKFSDVKICWTPGSTLNGKEKTFQIQAKGIWKAVESV